MLYGDQTYSVLKISIASIPKFNHKSEQDCSYRGEALIARTDF